MPKAAVLQSSFSSGEVSPLYYGQADNPRYKKALETGFNFFPLLQGPIVRRPGTKFCAIAKTPFPQIPPILVPFVFSETQSYMLEFGSHYIRFYTNNGQMVTSGASFQLTGVPNPTVQYVDPFRGTIGSFYATRALAQLQNGENSFTTSTAILSGSILELLSPYLASDLPLLRWAQSNDTLYLIHPNYPVYKLQRQAHTYWRLIPVAFQDGPYLPLNSYQTIGDCANFNIQITTFSAPPPGIGRIQTVGFTVSGAITDPGGSGQIQITTSTPHGILTGQNVFINGIVGTTEANNWDSVAAPGAAKAYWPVQVTSPTTLLLIGSTFTNAYVSGGSLYPALFANSALALKNGTMIPDAGRILGFIIAGVRYFGYLSTGNVSGSYNAATWPIFWPKAISTGSTITAWQLGVYSPGFGFPRCVSFHQNRLVLGGPGDQPQEIDGSTVGSYENFAPSNPANLQVSDSNAYSFILNSSDSNVLQWLSSTAQGLLAGTYVAEWLITPNSTSDALTPTNFNAQQTSFFGGASAGVVQLGNSTFYIQRAFRKIREMSFFFAAGTFRSIDMTELSEHLTVPKVTQLAVTKETQPILWAVRSDGALIAMIFNRDDLSLIAGWTKHVLGGSSDSAGTQPIVSSIGSIPSPDLSFDQLWMVVQRYINGVVVYSIEYMTKIFDDSIAQEDAFELDCGATFYNPFLISDISIANPCVVTTSLPSGFVNGDRIRITGVVGLNHSHTDANGNVAETNIVNGQDFIVAGVVGNTFQLHDFSGNPVSSLGFSAFSGSATSFVSKLVTTISGLTWLENETLSVLADGGIHPPVVVSNSGQVTLKFPAAKVQLGYGFKSQAKLLRADAGSPDGSSIGKTRRTTRIAVQMHRTGDLALGTSFQNLIPVQLAQADVDQADQAPPLFSGMIREGLESAYDFESQPCIQMSSSLPGCIQSVTSFMEEFDV